MKKLVFSAFIVAALAAGAAVFVRSQAAQAKDAAAQVGAPAPAFTLPDEVGTGHDLRAYRGKIVVLEWTNPQCPFVARHYRAGTMESLAAKYGDRVAWLAVNSSHFNRPEDSRAWKQKEGLPYPVLQDPSGTVGRLYGARTTPHLFVIDGEGILRYAGAIDDDPAGKSDAPRNYVAQAVDALLAGQTPPVATSKPYGCSVKYGRP